MVKLQIVVLSVFAVLGYIKAFGQVGKCNTENLAVVPLPVPSLEQHAKWRVAYATDVEHRGDHEDYFVQTLGGKNYKMVNTKVYKDKSEAKHGPGVKYVDNVFIEDFEDKRGKRHRAYMHPLKMTKSLAVLVYRCSDNGNPNVDYRFIAFPEDVLPDDSEIQELLAFDKATFPDSRRGTLVKLPEQIKD